MKNIDSGNYDQPTSANVETFTEQKVESNPLFDIAGGVVGSVVDNYVGLPTGTTLTVGGYFLGGDKNLIKKILSSNKKLN